MIKRILPIYRTGWFYLILIYCAAIFYAVSIGGFNFFNQTNIDILEKLTPERVSSTKTRSLTDADVLTLHAHLSEDNIPQITSLLSFQPNSQVTILGAYSNAFIKKLEYHLSKEARAKKVVINSPYTLSEPPVNISSSMWISPLLNWFRFDNRPNITTLKSRFITYAPLVLNQRQSVPLLLDYQDKHYLTLPAEILNQLNSNNKLSLDEHWQLSLVTTEKTIGPHTLSLGFLGEVFTSGISYNLDEINLNNNLHYRLNNQVMTNKMSETPKEATVELFIKQQHGVQATSSPKRQYKVIFITDNSPFVENTIKPLLLNLSKEAYLSQSLFTILLTWLILIVGFIVIALVQGLTIKKQAFCIISYVFFLVIVQSFLFNQQQWFEIFPAVLAITGTWALFIAYQKETDLLTSVLNHQTKRLKQSGNQTPSAVKTVERKKIKQDYKTPQNFSPAETIAPEKPLFYQKPTEDLDKTMVITSGQKANQMNHHITVENFGRYQVEGILGKGAMGIVYQGVDPKINRHVAIKTLQLGTDLDSKESDEAKERFFREAQTAGGLSHANIVTIYDVGEENNLGYIAMDLLTGAPLSLFTQLGQTLPVPLIYQLLIQITDALDYAHKQNVVHRDIKPANIIYDDDLLKVTVTDFGIAYVSDHSKTRTGVIMGSPYYMSPEQILGLKVDGRSDIFSLGVTFYQLLSGHLPFEGESIATVAYQITKAKPIGVNQHNAHLPPSALRITNKAMHKDIEKRYQSMAEFKLALINALKRDFKITAS